MLKIRAEHLSAFSGQQALGFTARMILHLREVFSSEVARLDDSKLRALIEKVYAQGEEWGITQEPLAERLLELFVSFEELRRDPLPRWIEEIVTHPGRSGVRVLLTLENGLWFRPVEPGREMIDFTFYGRVKQEFYSEIRLARPITVLPDDRMYRRKWKSVAARMRKSRAIPKKTVRSACARWVAGTARIKFPPVLLPSRDGAIVKVAVMAGDRP